MPHLSAPKAAAARRPSPRGGARKLGAARRFLGSLGSCVLLLVIGAAVSLPAAAQWKWRDASGRTQYSDLPPPAGTPEANILQRPAPTASARPAPSAASGAASAASAPPLTPKLGDPELEAKRKQAEEQEARKKKIEENRVAAAQAENCSRARGQLAALEQGQRIVRYNAKGEREYLDDKSRADEIQRVRGVIAADCK